MNQAVESDTHRFTERHIAGTITAISRLSPSRLAAVIDEIESSRRQGGTIWTCGNGGSASTAAHLALCLSHHAVHDSGVGVRAFCLSSDAAILTALANDLDYSSVFSRQIEGLAVAGDLLIAVSVSGCSANVVAAAASARKCNVKVAALVGDENSPLARAADLVVPLGTTEPAVAEDAALVAAHAISTWFRRVKH